VAAVKFGREWRAATTPRWVNLEVNRPWLRSCRPRASQLPLRLRLYITVSTIASNTMHNLSPPSAFPLCDRTTAMDCVLALALCSPPPVNEAQQTSVSAADAYLPPRYAGAARRAVRYAGAAYRTSIPHQHTSIMHQHNAVCRRGMLVRPGGRHAGGDDPRSEIQ
jgi:hypothetical protein